MHIFHVLLTLSVSRLMLRMTRYNRGHDAHIIDVKNEVWKDLASCQGHTGDLYRVGTVFELTFPTFKDCISTALKGRRA